MTDEDIGEFMKNLDIYAEVFQMPFSLILEVTKYRYQFIIGHYPGKIQSKKDPTKVISEKAELIPIDEYLGIYEPKKLIPCLKRDRFCKHYHRNQ